ncbi:MAG: hypothetical protein ACYDBB_19460 [Armatimonadota bacterium]
MVVRWFTPALLAMCFALAVLAQEPPKTVTYVPSTVVEIGPHDDNPMQLPAIKPLLATDAADRLNCVWPEKLTEMEYLQNVLTGKFDILKGWWPFESPTGDPSKFTRKDYIETIKAAKYMFPYYEQVYGKLGDPVKANGNAWEMIPLYVALWKDDQDPKHLQMVVRAIKIMSLALDEEYAKNPTTPPLYNAYWKRDLAYTYLSMLPMKDTPEFKECMAILGTSAGKLANAWPISPFKTAYNMSFMAAFWYDLSLKYSPQELSHAKEMKAYVDEIWHDYWDKKDMNEEDSSYTILDLVILHAWSQMRGEKWWTDPDRSKLFKQYAEQVANDGSWPAYGDGGASGEFLIGMWLGEMMASVTRDGHYKWLAHRAFWTARNRMWKLCVGSGYMAYIWLALGTACADDTVKEVAPKAGVTMMDRLLFTLTPVEQRRSGYWWYIDGEKRWVPRKLIFRGGPKETDAFMLVQAGPMAGHGHPDSGSIQFYAADLGTLFDYPTLRLDNGMESTNAFVLQDPAKPGPWPGRMSGIYTTEFTSVPVMGSGPSASYARLHIQEYPGTTTTEESWKLVQTWPKREWTQEKAIGYRNWPVRLDRSILFVNNKFTVVRDTTNWLIPATSRMGANWTFGQLGSIGNNWVNVWTPKVLFAYGTYLRPITSAPKDLFIWFAPRDDATLQIEKLNSVRKEIAAYYYPANSYQNMPLRAWYTRTGTWQPEEPQAFTTVLIPHDPKISATQLAQSIESVRDDEQCTAVRIQDTDGVRLAVINTSGKSVIIDDLVTDAEAALVTLKNGKFHISAWHATTVRFGNKVLLKAAKPQDVEKDVK